VNIILNPLYDAVSYGKIINCEEHISCDHVLCP